MGYGWAKLAHLVAIVLWMGPALGAYYFLIRGLRDPEPNRLRWVEALTERVLRLEHFALLGLIGSGIAMLAIAGGAMLQLGWLRLKLELFAGVLAFELFDIYVAHVVFRRLLARNVPPEDDAWRRAERLRRWVAIAAIPVGGLLVPAILALAVLKP